MKLFRTIFAPVLAILVFFNATSFTMSMHLCMGEVKNLAFFKAADACDEAKSESPRHGGACESIDTKSCCEDRTVFIEGNQQLLTGTPDAFKNLDSITVAYALLVSLVSPSSEAVNFPDTYTPPLIPKDIPVLIESFLI